MAQAELAPKNAKNTTQIFLDLYFLLRMYNLLFKATISKLDKNKG